MRGLLWDYPVDDKLSHAARDTLSHSEIERDS